MDVIHEIIQNSAIGASSKMYKSMVLLLFATIVSTLFTMLILLLHFGIHTNIRFGY